MKLIKRAWAFVKRNAVKAAAVVAAGVASVTTARADVTLPIDVSTASTTLASYIGPAAGFALVVAVAVLGCMIVWRVFKRIAKG